MVDIASLKIEVDATQLNDLLAEMKALREELRDVQLSIATDVNRVSKLITRFDSDGLPESR